MKSKSIEGSLLLLPTVKSKKILHQYNEKGNEIPDLNFRAVVNEPRLCYQACPSNFLYDW